MAVGKEIRTKIKSVQSTRKITRAMEMVAASKMRRAQEQMAAARPYALKMRNVISHLAHAHPEYQHPYLQDREVKRVGYIIVTSDRGLCGGLNNNLFKISLASMKGWSNQNVQIEACAIGQKALSFFRRVGGTVRSQVTHLGDRPRIEKLIGTIKVMLDEFNAGKIDRLFIVSNVFVNTMTQKPTVEQLLPIKAQTLDATMQHRWDYLYEPEAKEVLDVLMTRYIESLVYQGVVENLACEMAARMVAMKSASENAGSAIHELKLKYNKARQAAITQEISEVVSGAAAVS